MKWEDDIIGAMWKAAGDREPETQKTRNPETPSWLKLDVRSALCYIIIGIIICAQMCAVSLDLVMYSKLFPRSHLSTSIVLKAASTLTNDHSYLYLIYGHSKHLHSSCEKRPTNQTNVYCFAPILSDRYIELTACPYRYRNRYRCRDSDSWQRHRDGMVNKCCR